MFKVFIKSSCIHHFLMFLKNIDTKKIPIFIHIFFWYLEIMVSFYI